MAIIKSNPIGITLPIQSGKSGYFDQSNDSFTAYRMNITNLIRTIPGERRLNPTFGCRLWTLVFEPNDDFIKDKVSKIIIDDIYKWIPGVTVNSLDVNIDMQDIYKLYITIQFSINSISQSDIVKVIVNINRI